jgi:6-carboxyhexanoate--CoA ligase
MSKEPLYSLRMRAAQGGAHEEGGLHISGGERLGFRDEIEALVSGLLRKALQHSRGDADFINLTIEKVEPASCRVLPPLPVSTYEVADAEEGRRQAAVLLRELSVSEQAIRNALGLLGSVNNLRGAVLLDSRSGERLDTRGERGIRVSRMDWDRERYLYWQNQHPLFGSPRIAEAIALATKVAYAPGTVAELCWSDDPEYVTGYVGSRRSGYCRITRLKEQGDFSGGRVFFVEPGTFISEYIVHLERTPVWIG